MEGVTLNKIVPEPQPDALQLVLEHDQACFLRNALNNVKPTMSTSAFARLLANEIQAQGFTDPPSKLLR
jgi:hypothetical protein